MQGILVLFCSTMLFGLKKKKQVVRIHNQIVGPNSHFDKYILTHTAEHSTAPETLLIRDKSEKGKNQNDKFFSAPIISEYLVPFFLHLF